MNHAELIDKRILWRSVFLGLLVLTIFAVIIYLGALFLDVYLTEALCPKDEFNPEAFGSCFVALPLLNWGEPIAIYIISFVIIVSTGRWIEYWKSEQPFSIKLFLTCFILCLSIFVSFLTHWSLFGLYFFIALTPCFIMIWWPFRNPRNIN